jgi:hypothetical protein
MEKPSSKQNIINKPQVKNENSASDTMKPKKKITTLSQ